MRKLPELLTPTKLAELKVSATRKPADEVFLLGDAKQGALVRAITPVLGGNVESFDPGNIDVVRAPAIRGALRWWWRALHPELSTDELRKLERKVWGGVGSAGESDSARASPVRIDVQVTERGKGQVVAPGEHRRNNKGELKAQPNWEAAESLGIRQAGYALFPLQRSDKERNNFGPTGQMATKNWRVGLEFRLRVKLVRQGATSLSSEEEQGVRSALWLWLTFGGYGARTRRGFGALHAEEVKYEDAYKILESVAAKRPLTNRPTLAGCTVLKGPVSQSTTSHQIRKGPHTPRRNAGATPPASNPATGAGAALGVMLSALSRFRQGKDFGRDPGDNAHPGRSRWPEADSLRALSKGTFHAHKVDKSFKQASAPRAQFGLPMIVKFVTKDDEKANGWIASTETVGRWASPLLLRPVCIGKGEHVPLVIVLNGHIPSKAWFGVQDASTKPHSDRRDAQKAGALVTKEVDVLYDNTAHGGAREGVRSVLLDSGGSSLDAFIVWLQSNGFQLHGGAR